MKIFRDPIHDVINLKTGNKDIDELIIKLIDSKEFQRLRHIKQLGFSYLAYPSASHTRFEHSLGVAFVAKEFLDKIIDLEEETLNFFKKNKAMTHYHDKVVDFFTQTKREKPLTIVAALLHDIGHGAFSHVTESIVGISHEAWVEAILLGKTEINKILTSYSHDCPKKIQHILFSSKIISGKIDIDKMDYLLRDSHITGSGYGKFDIKWLFNVLTIGIYKGEVTIGLDEGKGVGAAEQFVMARIDMFKYIYLHKTTLVAENMLKALIKRLKMLHKEGKNYLSENANLARILFSSKLSTSELLEDYLAITDLDYHALFRSLQYSEDKILKMLSSGLMNRCLFKKVDKGTAYGLTAYINDNEGEAISKFYVFEIEIESYKDKFAYVPGQDEIILFNRDGKASDLSTKSVIIPPRQVSVTYHIGFYANSEINAQYLIEKKTKVNKSREKELPKMENNASTKQPVVIHNYSNAQNVFTSDNATAETVQYNDRIISSVENLIADVKKKAPVDLTGESLEDFNASIESIESELNKDSSQPKNKGILKIAIKSLKAVKGSAEFGAAVAALIAFVQNLT